MKSVVKTFTKLTAIFGILLLPVLVFAQGLNLPHQFFGSVNYTNGAAPNGLAVEARINGSVVGSSVTAGGNYGYNPNLLFALDNDGVHPKTIEFFVNGIKANETAVFVNGNSSQLNLTIPASLPTTPTPSPTPTTGGGGGGSTSGGGGGGGGGVTTPSTPTAPLSAAAQKVDANKDGKIDVLDFNTLMVNWGSTSVGNVADFNGDGKVDVFDFNLLMINWTL
jgi:hypothetical protein